MSLNQTNNQGQWLSSEGEGKEQGKDHDGDFAFDEMKDILTIGNTLTGSRKYVAYTIKLPSEQLAALQSIWLELKRMYGAHSPDKSGMIQQAIAEWLRKWDGPDKQTLLQDLLQIRQNTRKRQYKK